MQTQSSTQHTTPHRAVMQGVRYEVDHELLDRARLAAGLSVPDLAARAGVPYTSLYEWLTGKKQPTSRNLGKVAGALDRDPGDFFRRIDTPDQVLA